MGLFGKTTTIRADKVSNFSVNTAEYGASVMELLGTTRVSGNVIYYDDFTAHEHRKTQRSGKGGGSKTVTFSYTYTVATIFGLCEGEIDGIGRVWIGKEIYDYPNEKIGLTLFKGTQEQQPWSYVVGKHPEKALPYKGLAYMAGVIDLGENASMPNFNFEVKGKLLNTGDGIDVNPADYILYVLDKVGMSGIDIVGINNFRDYCRQADLLISTPSDATDAQSARDIINSIAELTNAYVFWSNDCFKIVPLADRPVGTWKPNTTIVYDLTPDDFLAQRDGAMVSFSRKDSSEVYNRFTVEFLNRSNGYEKESVSYEDADDIRSHGVRQSPSIKAHYVYTKARAVKIAEEMARKNKFERNKYTFKLGWAFCRLEVGDLVTLTDPAIGLEKVVACIDSVTESADGALTFTALSRAEGDYSEAVYDVYETERPFIDFNFDPGWVDYPEMFQPDASLMHNDNEIWIAVKGQNTDAWGGCNVWVSDNNANYRQVGKVEFSARMGELANDITADATSLEVAINGELISGTEQDAERGNTLLWLDGESLSYTTATLLENGNYRLEGLVRGQYGTIALSHKAGKQVVRCDDAIIKPSFLDDDIGKTVFFKFTSFNIFGGNEQSLADVSAYSYVIKERTTIPPDVKALDVEVSANGTRRYYIDFEYPEVNNIAGFRMKYAQGTLAKWETAFEVQDGLLLSFPYETNTVRQGPHVIMIKAVNTSGNESRNCASVLVNFAEPLEDNVLYKVNFADDDWANVETNGNLLSDGYIHARQDGAFWKTPESPFWGNPDDAFWGGASYLAFELTASVTALAAGNFFFIYDIVGPANIMYRMASKEDNLWKPYATKFKVDAGDVIEIKFTSLAGAEETVLRSLIAVIDVPDRTEHFENLVVPVGGVELPIVTPNYHTTAVRIDSMALLGSEPIYARIESKNPCIIKLVNSTGQVVSSTVDVTWQGFTKEILGV
jgi:hypothetical protein